MTFKIAAVQAAPVFLDREATIDRACALIADAAAKGASLVVFPEAFVPGYPDWVWLLPNNRKADIDALHARLVENAVTVPGEATDRLCQAAAEAKVHVAIGINERNGEASNATLYNSLLYIDDDGDILGVHRKLVPTGGERLTWGQGDGGTMDVYDTALGRLGGLICWENYMPLARYANIARGVEVHVAPTWDSSPAWQESLRHIAREGGMFVVGCCMAIRMDDLPDDLVFKSLYPDGRTWVNKGNSCIVAPDGSVLAGPVAESQEILLAEVDLGRIPPAKRLFDAAGHYARPDVFKFALNDETNHVMWTAGEGTD